MKNLKEPLRSLVLFSLLLSLSCSTGRVKEKRSSVFLREGIAAYNNGDYEKAISKFEEALKFSPDNPEIYYWEGKTYFAMRQMAKAEGVLRKALGLKPGQELREKIENLLSNLEVEPSLEQPSPPEEEEPEFE